MNHYAYASSNPIKYSDPTGLFNADEFWEKMSRADFLFDIIVSGGVFLLVAFLVEYFSDDPDNAPVANINVSINSGGIPLGENGSYDNSYYDGGNNNVDIYDENTGNLSSFNDTTVVGDLLKMTYLNDSLNNYLYALYKPGQHDQQELYGVFGNKNVGNLACDFTAIYNNLEIRNNVARTPEQFKRDAQLVLDAGLIRSNGGYTGINTGPDINIVRERIANFLNKRVFAKDRFGINESVSFNFVERSEINTYSIIQNTTIQNGLPHFVNVVSINGNMVKIRDTYNGNIENLDLTGSGFNTNKLDWRYSFTNMTFYYPGGN